MRLTNHPVAVDLAWNVESAAKVKPFIDAALDAFRFSRPIVLYVKYYLHVQGLRDPFHGGNGSYVLSMLVMLHLPQVNWQRLFRVSRRLSSAVLRLLWA